jgi:hypothetical protein
MNPFRKKSPPPYVPSNRLLWTLLVLCVIVACQSVAVDAFALATAAMPVKHVPIIWGCILVFLAGIFLPRRR